MAFPDFLTHSFTTAVVPAQTVLDVESSIGVNRFYIHKLVITPSEAESNNRFEIYGTAVRAADDLMYGTVDFEGTLTEPMEERGLGPTERREGFVAVYIDNDLSGTLHFRFVNNHTADQTYDVTLVYAEQLRVEGGQILGLTQGDASGEAVTADRIIATGTGLTGGGNLTADRTLSVVADSTRQLINVKVDGVSIGTVPILDIKGGLRLGAAGVLNGTAAEVTLTASNQVANTEALIWASLTF